MRTAIVCAIAIVSYGCAQAQNAIVPGVDFATCALTTYEAEPVGTPIATVIFDVAQKCGGDATQLIRVLDAHEAPGLHATKAHVLTVTP